MRSFLLCFINLSSQAKVFYSMCMNWSNIIVNSYVGLLPKYKTFKSYCMKAGHFWRVEAKTQ